MSEPSEPRSTECVDTTQSQFTEDDVRKIVGAWRRLIVFSSILGFFTLLVIGMLFYSIFNAGISDSFITVLLSAIGILYGTCVYSTLARRSWARGFGIVVCCLLLFGFPVGTALGLFGLFSFQSAKPLFGHDAISYSEIKAIYDRMEAERTEALFPSAK